MSLPAEHNVNLRTCAVSIRVRAHTLKLMLTFENSGLVEVVAGEPHAIRYNIQWEIGLTFYYVKVPTNPYYTFISNIV